MDKSGARAGAGRGALASEEQEYGRSGVNFHVPWPRAVFGGEGAVMR